MKGLEAQSRQVSASEGFSKSPRKFSKIVITSVVVVAIVIFTAIAYIVVRGSSEVVTTPHSDLALVHADQFNVVPPYSVVLKFGGFTRYVNWSDVKIVFDDGNGSVTWLPSTAGLSGGVTVSLPCGQASLGNLSLTCNITDAIGNGAPNSGDTLTLTTHGNTTFVATQTYTVKVIYIPDGGLICSLSFDGTG